MTQSNNSNIIHRSPQFCLGFASLCACTFLATLDTIIVATALPSIASSLNASSTEAYWCGTGFLLTQTISQLLYAGLQTVFGFKEIIICALNVFLLASVLCATAQNISWLIVARMAQGLGGGGINAMVNVIIADSIPLQVRGAYIGLNQLAGAFGLVSGVILGASFAQLATWRLVFYVNVPICFLAAVCIALCVRIPRRMNHESKQSTDVIGPMFLAASMAVFLFGITSGGVLYPWLHARIIGPLVIGFVGLLLSGYYEFHVSTNPAIPPRIFGSRTTVVAYFSSWAHGLILWGLAYFLILYYLIGQNNSLLQSAFYLIPGMATLPVVAAVFGFAISFSGRFKWFNVLAWVLMTVGVSLLVALTIETPIPVSFTYQFVLGFGGGIIFPGRSLAVQASQKLSDIPAATTLVSFFSSLGESFGVAIGGTVLQNRWRVLTSQHANILSENSTIDYHAFESATKSIQEMIPDVRHIYQRIIVQSIRVIWISFAILAAITLLLNFSSKNIVLHEKVLQGSKDDDFSEQ